MASPPPDYPIELAPDTVEPIWIDSTESLQRHCKNWKKVKALGIDTEFVRTRTFFPRLGLIQVSDGSSHALIDPQAISLDPLGQLLQDSAVTKVLHSCGEDLEVFYHRFGKVPRPLFDTQIGAAFAGVGNSLGYSRLVREFFPVDLPKGETRSNWLKRPLTEAQMVYAALDVTYLLPLYSELSKKLTNLRRSHWMLQEVEQISVSERFLPDPAQIFLKFAHPAMSRPELAALQALAAWRETEARQRNLPRNFVLPKNSLTDIAKQRPTSLSQLERLRILKPHELRRFGKALLDAIKKADQLPQAQLPRMIHRPQDLSSHKSQVEHFRSVLATKAKALGLAPELVANRRMVESIWRRKLEGTDPVIPQGMTPWRQEILQEVLVAVA